MANIIHLADYLPTRYKYYHNPDTLRSIKTFTNVVSEAAIKDLCVSNINLDGYNQLKQYWSNKGLAANTIVSHTDKLKAALRAAHRDGYTVAINELHLMTATLEDSGAIALTPNEVARIAALHLEPPLSYIRDYFLIGCYTGLRFGDYSHINANNIKKDTLEVLTKKKKNKVIIPIGKGLATILQRYKKGFPLAYCNWYFNKHLPTIAAKARINDKVVFDKVINGEITQIIRIKHELVKTHTARRTFATNAYMAGIPTARVMLLTGHTTEQSFFKYIRISKQENADILKTHEFFKQ